jgi:hypothetical protein
MQSYSSAEEFLQQKRSLVIGVPMIGLNMEIVFSGDLKGRIFGPIHKSNASVLKVKYAIQP